MYKKVCYTNGSYFLIGNLSTANPLICGHSGTGGGQWLYPNGTTSCDSTSLPIKCTHDGNAIKLRKATSSSFYTSHELGYMCCLPHSCSNSSIDMIIANIFSKFD